MTHLEQPATAPPWSMIGHSWAVEHLKAQIVQGGVRHAYLFTGPDGVGRRTLALRFSQAINCTQPPAPGEFCGECRECRLLERMEHPDLSIVAPEEPSKTIKVDQIRLLQHSIQLAPYQAARRIALLLDFESANPSTSNALLKTLEEPPARVILLLTASDVESLLPTIVSRCEVIRLQPVPALLLEDELQAQWGIAADSAGLFARLAGGRPGTAQRFAAEAEFLPGYQSRLDDQRRLLNASRAERFAYAEKLSETEFEVQPTLQAWLSLWRDVLLRAAGAGGPLSNPDRLNEIETLAGRVGAAGAIRTINSLEKSLALISANVNRRLALEVLMPDLPRL